MSKVFLFICCRGAEEKHFLLTNEKSLDHARSNFRRDNPDPNLMIASIWECRMRFPNDSNEYLGKPQYEKVNVDAVKIIGIKFWWWMLLTIPIGAGMDALFYLLWRLIF